MYRSRVLLLAAGALFLAACSSGDAQPAPTTQQTVTSVSTAAPVTTTLTVSESSTPPIASSSAPVPTSVPPSSTSSAPVVTTAPGGGSGTLAGVSLDAPGDQVMAQLTALFGQPDSDMWGTGCSTVGAVSREVTWGGLSVYGEGPAKDAVRLDSYSVAPGAPRAVVIPHGVRFGMTQAELQSALPATAGWVEDSRIGLPYFETPEGLFVVAEGEFETFRVNPHTCT